MHECCLICKKRNFSKNLFKTTTGNDFSSEKANKKKNTLDPQSVQCYHVCNHMISIIPMTKMLSHPIETCTEVCYVLIEYNPNTYKDTLSIRTSRMTDLVQMWGYAVLRIYTQWLWISLSTNWCSVHIKQSEFLSE